jgi:hypothetical protein
MAGGRSKYKRVTNLFTPGIELEVEEGLVIWVQILNPYEVDDARGAAQAAKARMVLALEEYGSDEFVKYESYLQSLSRNDLIELIVDSKAGDILVEITDAIEIDPDWSERMAVLEREDELIARPVEDAERKLLEQYSREYIDEVAERMEYERKRLTAEVSQLDQTQLVEEYRKLWIDRRGGDRALEEYRLKEHYYAARVCDAFRAPDDSWDHTGCDHSIRVWETEEEVRHLPDQMREMLDQAIQEVTMSPKERSDSGSRQGSSASSPPPSEGEASPRSGPTAMSRARRGT